MHRHAAARAVVAALASVAALNFVAAAPSIAATASVAAPTAAPAHAALRVVDDTGAPVALAAPARRIVTLAPHATELVYAAGAGGRIVGVIKGSDYPPQALDLPVIGNVAALDLERIVMLAPDLVVTWPWTTPMQVAWLRARGIPIFETDAHRVADIASDIERIGVLAGTQPVALAAAAALRARARQMALHAARGPPLRVFYQLSDLPLYTLGGRHLVTRALDECGGANVFAALTIPAPQVSLEAVLAANPEVIIAGTDGGIPPPWLDRWKQWPALAAVRRGNLYTVDANLLHRPGPRFVDGMAQLCATLARARRAMPGGL